MINSTREWDWMDRWMDLRSKFEEYGRIETSNKYKQGVDIRYKTERYPKNTNGVYILTDGDDTVKIGNSTCIRKRFDILYKHVRNSTNDKIRAYVKEEAYLNIWVYPVETITREILDALVQYTPIDGLERHVIDTYTEAHGALPYLNSGRM